MPTKRNRAGNQQPYVPEGNRNGGEYADNDGGNVNYKPKESGESVKVEPKESTTTTVPKVKTTPKKETPQNQPVTSKSEDYTNGTPAEREKLRDKGISTISEDMKSADYTKKFCKNVKISRGSLSKDEIGEFNSYLETLFDEYPDMQKFNNITVRNNISSHKGGYVMTSTNYFTGEKSYDLYINSGWIEDRQKINDSKNIKWYQTQIDYMSKQLESITDETNKQYITDAINRFKNRIETINEESKKPKEQVYNVVAKCNSRSERLKSLMAHELMHRITQEFESFRPAQNPSKHKAYIDLTDKLKEVYTKAINNGDARRISTYATTNKSEFLSEANAMLEGGFEMPQYIKDVLLEVKEWNRRK